MTPDVLDVALAVARALEVIGAEYYIGGSVASSLQASARSTNDVDFVVAMAPHHAQALADELGPEFDVDVNSLREAIRSRWSWNIFHSATGVKIDLMMRQATEYDLTAFARRRRFKIDVDCEPFLKSVEDSILKKLQWYRDGGEQSSTQWRDVVELLRVNRREVDRDYLDWWAGKLGIAALLSRAGDEADRPSPK